MKHYNIPVFIPHLGCPFKCVFCNQNRITSQNRIPGPEDVVNIIEAHLETIPTDSKEIELAFFGGNFTALSLAQQEYYLASVKPYLINGRISSIRLSTRPDCIDENILSLLAKYGVQTIELGVQSLSDEVLKASWRGYSAQDVFKAGRLIKQKGFKLGIQLMIGLPGDSFIRDMETTRQTIKLAPHMVRIYPTLVIKDTYLEELFYQGSYKPFTLSEAINTCREMFLAFQFHNIPVIRMGLHPSEDLRQEGSIVCGPFHPGFGELVLQNIFKEQAIFLLKQNLSKLEEGRHISLHVNKHDVSKMIGHKRYNLTYLRDKFNLETIKVKIDEHIKRDSIGISWFASHFYKTLDRMDFIAARYPNN